MIRRVNNFFIYCSIWRLGVNVAFHLERGLEPVRINCITNAILAN
jgi:hypothetical protein